MRQRSTQLPDLPSLEAACACLPCPPPPVALPGLLVYLGMLMRYNAVMNLVGTRTWRETLELLLADSFCLARFLPTLPLAASPCCLEPGAGAGLPGIPLRLCWTEGEYALVEVRQKRALFLQNVLATLSLPRTRVHCGRVEEYCTRMPRKVDLWVSRAFMPWRALLELLGPHTAAGGLAVVLQNDPAPVDAHLPQEWELCASQAYTVRDTARHFWALRHVPACAPHAGAPHERITRASHP